MEHRLVVCGSFVFGVLTVACGGEVVVESGTGSETGTSSGTGTTTGSGTNTGISTMTGGGTSSGTGSGSVTSTGTSTTTMSGTDTGVGGNCAMQPTTEACRSCCAMEHPAGTAELQQLVFNSCGCSNNGVCFMDCAGDPACSSPGQQPSPSCQDCIDGIPTTEACALGTLADCQASVPCAEAVTCILSCP